VSNQTKPPAPTTWSELLDAYAADIVRRLVSPDTATVLLSARPTAPATGLVTP
jgi:hypothetical protein